MAKSLFQNIIALFLALLAAILILAVVEWIGLVLHPFPEDFAGTREEVMEQVANYPALILALLGGVGWGSTIIVATLLATRLNASRHATYGIGIGGLLLGAAIFNMSMLPYPLWYWALELVVLPLGIYLGVKFGGAA